MRESKKLKVILVPSEIILAALKKLANVKNMNLPSVAPSLFSISLQCS
jgi:hypothetical protein